MIELQNDIKLTSNEWTDVEKHLDRIKYNKAIKDLSNYDIIKFYEVTEYKDYYLFKTNNIPKSQLSHTFSITKESAKEIEDFKTLMDEDTDLHEACYSRFSIEKFNYSDKSTEYWVNGVVENKVTNECDIYAHHLTKEQLIKLKEVLNNIDLEELE